MQRLPKREVFQIQVRRKAFLQFHRGEKNPFDTKKKLEIYWGGDFFLCLAPARAPSFFVFNLLDRANNNNNNTLFYVLYFYFLKQLPIFPRRVTDNGR